MSASASIVFVRMPASAASKYAPIRLVERGEVAFIFQPRVERPFPHDIEDVQRAFLLLAPEAAGYFRRILLGHKRLPRPRGRRERFWSFIDRVGAMKRVLDGLEPYTYETETYGERFQPGARLVATGAYSIVRHGPHTHFSYSLTDGSRLTDVHEALGIGDRATYILLGMRPFVGGRGGPQWHSFPEEVRSLFAEKRFVDPHPDMLDLESMNLVLIGAGNDARRLFVGDAGNVGARLRGELAAEFDAWRPSVLAAS